MSRFVSMFAVGDSGIAFSAYLDHDITLGEDQTIKFNKVIVLRFT